MRDHYSPANIWAMHPKLSRILHLQEARVSKTPNGGRSGIRTVRTQSCDNQVHVKAAGELCSSTQGYVDAPNQLSSYRRRTCTPSAPQE